MARTTCLVLLVLLLAVAKIHLEEQVLASIGHETKQTG
jgi:hypothetical protein